MAKRHYSSKMISEDSAAPCNLPRNIIEKNYEEYATNTDKQIPDLQTGVEKMLRDDHAGMKRIKSPSKMGSKG